MAVFSVVEGEDKPLKYPHMFRAADLVLLNKVDLLPHVDFDADAAADYLRRVNRDWPIVHVSARAGQGIGAWYESSRSERAAARDGALNPSLPTRGERQARRGA